MTSAEMLDLALGAYRTLGWTLLRSALAPTLICTSAVAFVVDYVIPSLGTTRHVGDQAAQVVEAAITVGLAILVGLPLFAFGFAYISGVSVRLASEFTVGDQPDLEAAQRAARANLYRVTWVILRGLMLALLPFVISLALFFVGGFWTNSGADTDGIASGLVGLSFLGMLVGIVFFFLIAANQSLAAPVILIEELPWRAAVRRGRNLLRNVAFHGSGVGAMWSLYWYTALASFVIWLGAGGVLALLGARDVLDRALAGWPVQSVALTAFDLLPIFLVIWAILPFWGVAATVIYYERRIRLEGYDIDLLAKDIKLSPRDQE